MKTVVILSPYFPPSTLAGVHRARHLAKHLPKAGWRPIVLCVDEAFHEQPLDHELADLVPQTVEIVKVPAVSARLTRPFGLGEIGLRAYQNLRAGLFRLLSERDIGAVLITGSPFYPMLLAPLIQRRFGVPVVLDFQDPWLSRWGAARTPWSKAGIVHRLARALEPRALAGASFVTSVSDTQNDEMAQRYPWFDRARMAAVPIGCDPADFDALRAKAAGAESDYSSPEHIELSFVGTVMPRTEPVLRAVLAAFARAREADPRAMARVRLVFVGASNQPGAREDYKVLPLAEAMGAADGVVETPQRIPYLAALGVLARSHGLLLIGSDEPHYTASKIYPALMSGRPYLSLFHAASSAHEILAKAGGGAAFSFASPQDLAACVEPLAEAMIRLASAPGSFGAADPAAFAPYETSAIAQRFADIFATLRQAPNAPSAGASRLQA